MPFHAIVIMVLLPTEANINVIPAEASINIAARRRYHRCHCPLPIEAIIDVTAQQSY